MDSSELYSQARKARQNLDNDKSVEIFQEIVDQYSTSREAKWARGQLEEIFAARGTKGGTSFSDGSAFSQTHGTYKHKTMDWNDTRIGVGDIRLKNAVGSVFPDGITIRPRFGIGTNVIADRQSRQVTIYFSFLGFGFFSPRTINFDDIKDVRGSGSAFPGLEPAERMPVTTTRQEYRVYIKTKQGGLIAIAEGKSQMWYGLYSKILGTEDSTLGAQKLENELRKLIFMPANNEPPKYLVYDRADLPNQLPLCPSCGQILRKTHKKCPKCGNQL